MSSISAVSATGSSSGGNSQSYAQKINQLTQQLEKLTEQLKNVSSSGDSETAQTQSQMLQAQIQVIEAQIAQLQAQQAQESAQVQPSVEETDSDESSLSAQADGVNRPTEENQINVYV